MIINKKQIKTLIGPTNIIILKPKIITLPVIILMSDNYNDHKELKDFKLGINDYKVYDDKFLSLLNNSKYKVDIFFNQIFSIDLKNQKEFNNVNSEEFFTNKIMDNINCFNKNLKDTKCNYKNINWHYADAMLLYKQGDDYTKNIMYYINVLSRIMDIIENLIISVNIDIVSSNDLFIYDVLKFGINKEMVEIYYALVQALIMANSKDDILFVLKSITKNDKILEKQFKNNKIKNLSDIYLNYISERILYISNENKKDFDLIKNLSFFYDFIIDILFYIIQYLIKKENNTDIKNKYHKLKKKILKKINEKYNEEEFINFKKIIYIIIYYISNMSTIFFDMYNIARIHKHNNYSDICILITNSYNISSLSDFLTSTLYTKKYIYDSKYKNDTIILKINKKIDIDKMMKK